MPLVALSASASPRVEPGYRCVLRMQASVPANAMGLRVSSAASVLWASTGNSLRTKARVPESTIGHIGVLIAMTEHRFTSWRQLTCR